MKRTTREWARKAEADFRAAESLAAGTEPFHDQVCFHCQQSAEKYLKALLEELGRPVPKTHDLDQLLFLLQPTFPELGRLRRGLLVLTTFAVDARYPGSRTAKRQSLSARRWSGRVRDACRGCLGLPNP
jgi:HEPN domain-containing protein